MSGVRAMREALAPWHRGQSIPHMTDDEIVAAIEGEQAMCLARFVQDCLDQVNFCWKNKTVQKVWEQDLDIDPMRVETAAFARLRAASPESAGDAAARIYAPSSYTALWNEALDRGIVDCVRLVHDP